MNETGDYACVGRGSIESFGLSEHNLRGPVFLNESDVVMHVKRFANGRLTNARERATLGTG